MGRDVEEFELSVAALVERGINPDNIKLKTATMYLKRKDEVGLTALYGGNDADE